MKHYLLSGLLLLLSLCASATALPTPPTTGRPLGEALNPDGTLKADAAGSFDARAFRMGSGPDGRPVFRPAGVKGAGDERWVDGFGLPNGTDGTVSVVVRSGVNVYIGGDFRVAGNVVANGVAKWNGTAWSSLGVGMSKSMAYYGGGGVYALATASNGDVYAGGNFIQAGGGTATNVAKWNGTVWSSLGTGAGNGVNGAISALVVTGGGELYAGGGFTQAGGMLANGIAKWNGTVWSSLGVGSGNGLSGNRDVSAMVVASSGEVYVGGGFTRAGGSTANYVTQVAD